MNTEIKKVQGKYGVELNFVDDRIYLNYWDYMHGDDICCQLINGKLFKFVYTPMEVEQTEVDGIDIDPFQREEITIERFIELVRQTVESYQK